MIFSLHSSSGLILGFFGGFLPRKGVYWLNCCGAYHLKYENSITEEGNNANKLFHVMAKCSIKHKLYSTYFKQKQMQDCHGLSNSGPLHLKDLSNYAIPKVF